MSIGTTTAAITQDIKEWSKQPFRSDMGLFDWFLFTGVLIVASILWALVLRELKIKG